VSWNARWIFRFSTLLQPPSGVYRTRDSVEKNANRQVDFSTTLVGR